jgi:hypothetical protein
MTGALVIYAATFMRYSLAVTPKNYLLFACHLTNFGAQTTQAYRYLNYWKYVTSPRIFHLGLCPGAQQRLSTETDTSSFCSWGGREKQLAEQAAKGGAATEAGA